MLAPLIRLRVTRSRWPASARRRTAGRCRSRSGSGRTRRRAARRPGRALVHPAHATPSPPESASCSAWPPTRTDGRWPRGGSQAIADALVSISATTAATSRPATRCVARAAARRARRCCSTSRPGCHGRAARLASGASGVRAAQRFRYGAGRLQGRLPPQRPRAVDRAPTLPRGRHGAPRRHDRRRSPRAEADVARAACPPRPFVLVVAAHGVRPDAGAGGRPHALGLLPRARTARTVDASAAIEAQLDRFAPGFRDLVIARSVRTTRMTRGHEPEPRRRRHRRRRAGPTAAARPPAAHAAALPARRGRRSCARPRRRRERGVHGMCGHHAREQRCDASCAEAFDEKGNLKADRGRSPKDFSSRGCRPAKVELVFVCLPH